MVVFWTFRVLKNTLRSNAVGPLTSLCLPLVIGLAFLGWYNWARFDSVFETGFYYELAGPFLQKYSHVLFSPLYLLPNLYNYLIMRPKLKYGFPLCLNRFQDSALSNSHLLACLWFIMKAQSLEYCSVLRLSCLLLFPCYPSCLLGKKSQDQADLENDAYLFKWLIISLAGSFLFGFAPLVLYFFVETRYIIDFIPSLILLSIFGIFSRLQLLDPPIRHPQVLCRRRELSSWLFRSLIGTLLAFSANADNFQRFTRSLGTPDPLIFEIAQSISRLPDKALNNVFWSAYSKSPPTGKPRARRVTWILYWTQLLLQI